MATTFNKSFSG